VSGGPFRSLNLGLATHDEPALVFENRRRVAEAFGLEQVAALRQVHGSTVTDVDPGPQWHGFGERRRELPTGDALSTSSARLGLVVLTADCVPVAIADPVAHLLAVVHAGWRGVAAGILGQALALFPSPGRILAAVGPAVGPDHYEVGEEVVAAVGSASKEGALTRGSGARPHLDLPGTIARILGEFGIRSVERSEECTACQQERFFSYRRDGPTGRQALIAARAG
jgi:purine-nucleoside/S-methyl-5'-thioadenosine phosphorylase / adenosine deaminase